MILFLNIGVGELIPIAVVALLLFGGDKLPEVMKRIASLLKSVGRSVDSVKKEIDDEIKDIQH